MTNEVKIIDKIQKLLKLAESSNPNEAKRAAEKAQELMVKHNIQMQRVKSQDLEYIKSETESFKRQSVEDKFVNSIILSHFFVRIISSKANGGTIYNFIGEKSNVEMALYVRSFLKETFKRLWKEYSKETGAKSNVKQAFFFGVYKGLDAKMTEQRQQAEQEYGIVLVKDPKVDEKTKELFPRTSVSRARSFRQDDNAKSSGYEKGRNININRGISGNSPSKIA